MLLITDKSRLEKYTAPHRIWQGVSSIEVTKKGRVFITFYSGGTKEETGNFCVIIKSDDNLNTFSDAIAATFLENHRCYDPNLWIDPLGRLWFTWAIMPDNAVFASICNDPDADELIWGEPFIVGHDVMMNKPIVLSTGEWLFPIAVWRKELHMLFKESSGETEESGAFVYKTVDNGKTFSKLGGTKMPDSSCDENMVVEMNDGTLMMFVRTNYGIGVSCSIDRGQNWNEGRPSDIEGPCSRFHIRRLKSGRLLLINHLNSNSRSNLAAFLSDDEGKTWKYSLLLDERYPVSYPDATEAEDGFIYVTYDCNRGVHEPSLEAVYECEREILVAKITEKDIIAGTLVDPQSRLKIVASKLGEYTDEDKNPFGEVIRMRNRDYVNKLVSTTPKAEMISKILDDFSVNCINMHHINIEKLDEYIADFEKSDCEIREQLLKIVRLIRLSKRKRTPINPLIVKIKETVIRDYAKDVAVSDIANEVGMSVYYMCHLFKKETGVSVSGYRNSYRIAKAKELLITTNDSITSIALRCGFNSASYFTSIFSSQEGVLPTKYRRLHKLK